MMSFNWSIGVLVLAPILSYIIAALGIFDIKKESARQLFKDCLEKCRNEKLKIWKNLLLIREQSLSENLFDDQLNKVLENEERYDDLCFSLGRCRVYFDFYYNMLAYIFSVGALIGMAGYFLPEFFIKEIVITVLSILSSTSFIFVVFGILFLKNKKDKLDKMFEKIIDSSSTTIKF